LINIIIHIYFYLFLCFIVSHLLPSKKSEVWSLIYVCLKRNIFQSLLFFCSNFSESLQLNGSNVANVKLKETVWHENSLNATMQKESRSRNWRILVYTACVVCLHSDSERRTSGTIYAMSCWECRSRRGGSNMWKIHCLSTTKNRAKHNGWFQRTARGRAREYLDISFFENWRHILYTKSAVRSRTIQIQPNRVSFW